LAALKSTHDEAHAPPAKAASAGGLEKSGAPSSVTL